MDQLKTQLNIRANEEAKRFWIENIKRIETVAKDFIKENEATVNILTPVSSFDNFDRMFMTYVGIYVYTDPNKTKAFARKLTEAYKKEGFVSTSITILNYDLGIKFRVSDILICSIYRLKPSGIPHKHMTSTISGKEMDYIPMRYFLPYLYKWMIEELSDNQITHKYIAQLEASLRETVPHGSMPEQHGKFRHMKNLISGLNVVISDVTAAKAHIMGKLIDNLEYPLSLLTDDPANVVQEMKKRLESSGKKDIEIFPHRIDHPGFEKYITTHIMKSEGRRICTITDYPRFGIIRVLEEEGIRYTDIMSTLLILHLNSWGLESKQNPFVNMIYGLIHNLQNRLQEDDPRKSKYYGTYFGNRLWMPYIYM